MFEELSLLSIQNKIFRFIICVYYKNLLYVFQYLDIDSCDPDPCLNGTRCNDQLNGYSCICTDGYNGTDCERGNYMTLFYIL